MKPIIEVKNLSKKYKISHRDNIRSVKYKSLREDIVNFVRNPFENINSDLEDFYALKNISFEISKGETIGIIGANGAGKSTLLKILGRVAYPSSGEVIIRGRVSSLLEVGTGFHPELTGRENIYLSGAILGMKKKEIDASFKSIVSFAEIETFLDTPVKHYSSGMFVRLAFAVASHLKPEILLVDEILAVGDTRFQKKSLGKMGSMGKSGRTILFVSHNLTALRSFCKKGILIDKGEIKFIGPIGSVIDRYLSDVKNDVLETSWSNLKSSPHNTSAVLKNVKLLTGKTRQLSTDTKFKIQIEYEVLRDGGFVGFLLIFSNSENNVIFQTRSNHEEKWYGKPMKKGLYKSYCHVPSKLLNSGLVNIRLQMFDANFSDPINVGEVLRFDISDGTLVRGDFHGTYEGIVRPFLEWDTQRTK